MNDYSIPAACATIASSAAIRVQFLGESVATAVHTVACDMAATSRRAATRTGEFQATLSPENAELHALYGSVAQDVIYGDVARPSTGNVLDYTRALAASLL